MQREIVYRLFDGAVTGDGGEGVRVARVADPGVAPAVTAAVVPVAHDVRVEDVGRRAGCGFDTPKGTKCKLCGKVH